ncbi:mechanosensitive ion channel family protein [Corynebacterium terpenotabidum]|uniref:Mechanosensitive ion channel MscS domain-containing protein n=1 Tax=Corynebacterium terpenotabidum Y-11 TaxID=1200352 RepID=S4XD61_9CORY|nr:mechanosensitive ion channel family protein [Corynebacterium terpenotabidum]AGP31087.1 hypothetical protein A606_07200 [Corynebacterium terpenotabidum Y-11]
MDWKALLLALWTWVVGHGLPLAAFIIVGMLVPRLGRLVVRIVTRRMSRDEEQAKSQLALVGALVYLLEIVAYFFIVYSVLTNLGVSSVGAAVPATVVSAAIGFGAQKVIADFLAGFFIISEHQYGVGDVVAFDGTSEKVKGTVVALTLRATQIRTGNGELVTLPNSQAGITINSSQEWSRAVVDLELPMTEDDTMASLADTVSIVTQRAIDEADIRGELLGEVSVLPAMSITAPTAAGLPWTVGIQVSVDVNPATQWKVQRIIRAALINEFWDRFQAPGDRSTAYAGPPTQAFAPVTVTPKDTATATADPADAVEAGEPRPADATPTSEEIVADRGTATGAFDSVAEDVAANGIWRNLDADSKFTRALTLGGRIRPSTGLLVIGITALALVGILAANPDGGSSGILSPDRWSPVTSTDTPQVATGTDAPAQEETAPETQEPTLTTPSGQDADGDGIPDDGATDTTTTTDGVTTTPQTSEPSSQGSTGVGGRSGSTTGTTTAP